MSLTWLLVKYSFRILFSLSTIIISKLYNFHNAAEMPILGLQQRQTVSLEPSAELSVDRLLKKPTTRQRELYSIPANTF